MAVPWPVLAGVCVLVVLWAGLIVLGRWIRGATPRPGSFVASATLRLIQVYARLVHRLHVVGAEHIPPRDPSAASNAPLLVVVNHTAGVDPLLVQAAIDHFEIRWVMAEDMRLPQLEWFWRWAEIIFVDRDQPGHSSLSGAMRHLSRGGVLGLFPEGRIERPAKRLLPFQPGVGVLVRKTGARVLPVVVSGTPEADTAWGSLLTRSNACVEFLPIRTYHRRQKPGEITDDVRAAMQRATGWPALDDPRDE